MYEIELPMWYQVQKGAENDGRAKEQADFRKNCNREFCYHR